MISVDVVSDYRQFLALEGPWNETVDRAGLTHPFLRHEWLRTWWDCFAGPRRLLVMLVRNGPRLLAVSPFMLERARIHGVPVRRIQFLHNEHTPRADVVIAERAEEVYPALWRTLLAGQSQWDVLQLCQLTPDSQTPARFSAMAAERSFATGMWRCDNAPYLELTGDWQGYFSGRTAKLRQNLRNRLGRLKQLGEPALEVLSDPAAIRAARGDALALESSGWKRDEGTAICSSASVERFYTELAERAAASGWLRLLFLKVGDRRIATSYGANYQGRLFLFKTGYDPEFAKCSPFKLLTYFAIQDACAGGLREVDFLGDAEPWKLEWTATTRPHDWLFVFANSSRAKLAHAAKFRLAPLVKRWLRR